MVFVKGRYKSESNIKMEIKISNKIFVKGKGKRHRQGRTRESIRYFNRQEIKKIGICQNKRVKNRKKRFLIQPKKTGIYVKKVCSLINKKSDEF